MLAGLSAGQIVLKRVHVRRKACNAAEQDSKPDVQAYTNKMETSDDGGNDPDAEEDSVRLVVWSVGFEESPPSPRRTRSLCPVRLTKDGNEDVEWDETCIHTESKDVVACG